MIADSSQQAWMRLAEKVVWRMNFGWWMESSIKAFPVVAGLGAVFILAGRFLNWPAVALGTGTGILLLLLALGAGAWNVRRYYRRPESLVFLDYILGLKGRLLAAKDGAATWPAPPETLPPILPWKGRPFGVPLAIGGVALVLALTVPVTIRSGSFSSSALEKPPALVELQQWVETLQESEVIDPEAVEELDMQARELAEKPPAEWYSHHSLEAIDGLKKKAESDMRQLSRDLERVNQATMSLEEKVDAGITLASLTPEESEALRKALGEAPDSLAQNGLKPNQATMDVLKKLKSGELRTLTSEELKKLRRQISNGSSMCKKALGEGEGAAVVALQESSGGVSRGPGTAPITLTVDPTKAVPGSQETLSNSDLTRAAVGDLLGTTDDTHDADKTYHGAVSGGGAAGAGSGGESVWMSDLTPEERQAVKKVFE